MERYPNPAGAWRERHQRHLLLQSHPQERAMERHREAGGRMGQGRVRANRVCQNMGSGEPHYRGTIEEMEKARQGRGAYFWQPDMVPVRGQNVCPFGFTEISLPEMQSQDSHG